MASWAIHIPANEGMGSNHAATMDLSLEPFLQGSQAKKNARFRQPSLAFVVMDLA